MFELDKTWKLDERLQADTFPIMTDGNCQYLLMNDKRWLWVIIVPQIVDAQEFHDLPASRQGVLMQLCGDVSKKLKAFSECEKINTAMIGNIVRQLHVHVIARRTGDANWPGPVWGHGEAQKYTESEGQVLARQLKEVFRVPLVS